MSAILIKPRDPHESGRGHSRELVLVVCLLSLIGLFSVTAFASRMYHKRVHTLADQWFAQGQSDYKAGDVKKALTDYRTAFVYSPTNPVFQFHLAQALAANGDFPQAQAYLQQLLFQSPGSGEINLALARIATRQSKTENAMMYYNGAIYGEWADQPFEKRWDARHELCEYLLDKQAMSQAESAVISLADNTPEGDVEKEKTVGKLLLRAQMWDRALDEFRPILIGGGNDPEVWEGAGVAAYNLGQYSRAVSYLDRVPRDKVSDPGVATKLHMARLIAGSNPFLPGLKAAEKARRTANALRAAEARARACTDGGNTSSSTQAPSGQLAALLSSAQAQEKNWTEKGLEHNPDRINSAMDLVFQIENEAANTCSGLTDEDQAILIIGQSRAGSASQ